MVWEVMSKNGFAALSFLPPRSTINGTKYVEMLAKKLKLHKQYPIVRYLYRMAPLATVPNLQRTFWIKTKSNLSSD